MPSIVLYAEDVFAGTNRAIGVASLRPPVLESIRRTDPSEDVWLIAVDPASLAAAGEVLLPAMSERVDACPSLALVADGAGGIGAVAAALSVARGDVPPQQACLARSFPTHTQIGEAIDLAGSLRRAELTFAVNGNLRQRGSLSDLVVEPAVLLRSIERLVHLSAGDVVLLGAPSGTAADRSEGWLAVGDRLTVELKLGSTTLGLESTVVGASSEGGAGSVRAPRVFGTGTNYRSHVAEMGSQPPPFPTANFLKLPGAVCASGTEIAIPAGSQVDYEGEIAVVVGEPLADLTPAEVGEADISLCLANDVTAREAPMTHLTLAKSAPGFCPLGSERVPVGDLDLTTLEFFVEVNGDIRQHGRAEDMVFGIAELVASFSRALALRPGDVILTGSPAGVGAARTPQTFLRPGDTVRIRSPQLGDLENQFVAGRPREANQ